ncbi:MAG: PIN domain-containing protein [Caldilineaceae bacterium]
MADVLVVLDTNVFVAAGFNPASASARLLTAVRHGQLPMVWNEATRREIEYIVRKIPRLDWADFHDLFHASAEFTSPTDPASFAYIPDPDDRKFIALAAAAGATLVTNDAHLLADRAHAPIPILTPSEWFARLGRSED